MNFKTLYADYIQPKSGDWQDYLHLIRFDRPIGSLLLLWPTLWALLLASGGKPQLKNLIIFSLGVFVMRSAGCVINDYADRHFDGAVNRTQHRPLPTGRLSENNALAAFALLVIIALVLVLATNGLTIAMAAIALLLASAYPYAKRHTHLAQVVLGAAYSWAIPMAFTAETGDWPPVNAWLVYVVNLIWVVLYDTFYAMVDREDDLKIGVKSTAVLFAEMDLVITRFLQALTVIGLLMLAGKFELGGLYYLGVAGAAALFAYQQWLVAKREPSKCFAAFMNNQWVGFVVFIFLALDYLL